jgi:uncharacterized protein (DUF305 family)
MPQMRTSAPDNRKSVERSDMRAAPMLAVLLLALTACGSDPSAGAPPSPRATASEAAFNATDVMFLQMMVAHHEQGLQMVRLAEGRAADPEVRTLAAAIDTTQTAEVATMKGWLKAWGQPTTPATDPNAHAHHGGMPATGPAEIAALGELRGAEFDKALLNLLIGHQHNAVDMARMQVKDGTNPQASVLATQIEQSRTAQISLMLRLVA